MSVCSRCGAPFGCAMADGGDAPCWCTELPPVVPVPGAEAGCWCPACLRAHIAAAASDAALEKRFPRDD
ncbi:cysteine-rich CWC family protein [Massilia suwonensis]|uniref:Cysteine-rich CWC family protein n=1 Tax=Massilia suwonensis TaxID=648895 RepID=A0ABW0MK79_9BURK